MTISSLINTLADVLSQKELAPYMALWSPSVHYRITEELTLQNTEQLNDFMLQHYFYEGVEPGKYSASNLVIAEELSDAAIFGFDLVVHSKDGEASVLGSYKACKAVKVDGEWKILSLNFYAH
ncbi:MAG: hypothetical protein F6J87_22535 [Spirulina sp. SIO3F2]|nr:hypothetical protein [Spirulina sp. SIO3F2]